MHLKNLKHGGAPNQRADITHFIIRAVYASIQYSSASRVFADRLNVQLIEPADHTPPF